MKAQHSAGRLVWLLFGLGLALAIRQWLWMPVLVVGASMQPTLRNGQLLGVNKLAYLFDTPRRGDIVVLRTNSGLMTKRILGLPGETVALREGVFYVNGRELSEPYVADHDLSTIGAGQLSPESYVVAGDNRLGTLIAVVNRDRIVGRVMSGSHPVLQPVVGHSVF